MKIHFLCHMYEHWKSIWGSISCLATGFYLGGNRKYVAFSSPTRLIWNKNPRVGIFQNGKKTY